MTSMRFFPELWGQQGIFGGRYMTLLGLISQEQNGNLNVASDVNCIKINCKPLLEMTLKITPFELPGRVFSPTSFVHRWELQLILKKDNKFTSLSPFFIRKSEELRESFTFLYAIEEYWIIRFLKFWQSPSRIHGVFLYDLFARVFKCRMQFKIKDTDIGE